MDNETRARFDCLETRVRRWQAACVGTLALAGVAVAVASSRPTVAQQQQGAAASDVLRAKKLEIVNDAGRAVVILAPTKGGGSAAFVNNNGQLSAGIYTSNTGNTVTAYHANGKRGATLEALADGSSGLRVEDKDEKDVAAFPAR